MRSNGGFLVLENRKDTFPLETKARRHRFCADVFKVGKNKTSRPA